MSQIVIPTTPVPNPSDIASATDRDGFSAQLQNLVFSTDELNPDVNGNKDPGTGYYGSPGGNGTEGNYIQYSNTASGIFEEGIGTFENLERVLNSALDQDWNEKGNPPNSLIVEALSLCGIVPRNDRDLGWCAAFVTWALAQAQYNGLRSSASQDYRRYGIPVDWQSWHNVRRNDIVVLKNKVKQGGHVGFIRNYDPRTGAIQLLGGNQKNRVKVSTFKPGENLFVVDVRRNWTIPLQFDIAFFDTGTGSTSVIV